MQALATTRELPRRIAGAHFRRLLPPIVIFLVSRAIALLGFAVAGASWHHRFWNYVVAWDGRWYLQVAQHGYPTSVPHTVGHSTQTALGFFPAFPLVLRAAHTILPITWSICALVTNVVLGLLGTVVLWILLAETEGPLRADRGVALVVLSPAAFVLSMAYGEALLLATVAGALLLLRRRRWIAAGLVAAVATATDPIGMAVIVPCLLAACRVSMPRRRSEGRHLAPFSAPCLAPMGVVGYFAYLWAHTGSPFAWFVAQRHGWQYGTPFSGVGAQFIWVAKLDNIEWTNIVKAASSLIVIGLAAILWRRRREFPETVAYTFAALFLAAWSPLVAWSPRVALRAFPLLAYAPRRLNRRATSALLVLSAALMVFLEILSLGTFRHPFSP